MDGPADELVELARLPEPLRRALLGLVRLLVELKEQIAGLAKQIVGWHKAAVAGPIKVGRPIAPLQGSSPDCLASVRNCAAW